MLLCLVAMQIHMERSMLITSPKRLTSLSDSLDVVFTSKMAMKDPVLHNFVADLCNKNSRLA